MHKRQVSKGVRVLLLGSLELGHMTYCAIYVRKDAYEVGQPHDTENLNIVS